MPCSVQGERIIVPACMSSPQGCHALFIVKRIQMQRPLLGSVHAERIRQSYESSTPVCWQLFFKVP